MCRKLVEGMRWGNGRGSGRVLKSEKWLKHVSSNKRRIENKMKQVTLTITTPLGMIATM